MEKSSVVMKKLSLTFCIFFFAISASAQFKIKQSKASQDYLVNMEQDTLWGEIRYGNHIFGSRLNKIILVDDQGQKIKFKAHEIKGFRNDRSFYDAIDIDGYKYFARKVVSGTVNMYFFEYTYASNYNTGFYSQKDDIGVSGKTVSVYLERNGNVQRVFKKKVSEDVFPFIGDNQEIMDAMNKGECTFDDLDQVVASYNEWHNEK
ncbi:MAG: hypothetical protein AAF487_10365 [Bacteroidota bacterium]